MSMQVYMYAVPSATCMCGQLFAALNIACHWKTCFLTPSAVFALTDFTLNHMSNQQILADSKIHKKVAE